jgi:hypothetical protein
MGRVYNEETNEVDTIGKKKIMEKRGKKKSREYGKLVEKGSSGLVRSTDGCRFKGR